MNDQNIQQSQPDNALNWKHEESIAVPSPDQEKRMAVRIADWDRIRDRLSQISDPFAWVPIIYSILFGVAGTSGLSIIPICLTENRPAWVIPLYIIITFLSLFTGSAFVAIYRIFLRKRKSGTTGIVKDMDSIEAMFGMQPKASTSTSNQ